MRHSLLTSSRRVAQVSALAMLTALSACSKQEPATQTPPVAETQPVAEDALVASINGEWRSADDKSRDVYRHPKEALEFWGLAPGMTILEVQPGGGWWSDILAAYAKATGGQYYATAADLDNPELSEAARQGRKDFEARFAAKPDVYGTVQFVNFGPKSAPLPENTFDFALTARSFHGWMGNGLTDKYLKDLYGALKPGGILAIEQHRANPGEQDPKAPSGYVTEAYVIEQAQKAGFELVERSEINANAKDTKDHPFGVWTLPPTKRTRPYSEGADAHDPNFDRAKYDAIGESDRMTLKFRKPPTSTT
ncbi:class I SAM-dependent methyltransferase [Steroidobacter sp. S1-65]|uniref:Class I SAM-dependent methyltransferase n=1 Tax=Steroidobacter gossypii TaxID=2805490 RepID=A0ABS1X4D5_9GAMM|nr:methyltransferase domain-containing protein [Steroidobacter gossypii]MBM0108076.1 class I SAM-dependent methyltransferase [Steroidobacter gossypii]